MPKGSTRGRRAPTNALTPDDPERWVESVIASLPARSTKDREALLKALVNGDALPPETLPVSGTTDKLSIYPGIDLRCNAQRPGISGVNRPARTPRSRHASVSIMPDSADHRCRSGATQRPTTDLRQLRHTDAGASLALDLRSGERSIGRAPGVQAPPIASPANIRLDTPSGSSG